MTDKTTVNNNSTNAWNIILNAYNANYIIGIGTPSCGTNTYDVDGLPCGHAYSVLGAFTL